MKTISANVKRAAIEMILLSLLCEQDMYGYEMVQEIKKRSNGEYALLEGSMYPILYRLAEVGDVVDEERKVGVRLTRVYYHITDTGRAHLRELIQTFDDQIALVNTMIRRDV